MPLAKPADGFTRMLASLNADGRYGLGLIAAWLLLLAPTLGGNAARELFRYERLQLADGELWRLVTAHLLHLNLEHAVLNALGATLLWALFAREYPPRVWLAIAIAGCAAIDAGLWFREPGVQWYLGASGLLHACMAAGVLAQLRRRDPVAPLLMLLLIAKLAYEEFNGALPFAGDVPVVAAAHLYGAGGGLLGGAIATVLIGRRREPL